jgi:hypothetical protein
MMIRQGDLVSQGPIRRPVLESLVDVHERLPVRTDLMVPSIAGLLPPTRLVPIANRLDPQLPFGPLWYPPFPCLLLSLLRFLCVTSR